MITFLPLETKHDIVLFCFYHLEPWADFPSFAVICMVKSLKFGKRMKVKE